MSKDSMNVFRNQFDLVKDKQQQKNNEFLKAYQDYDSYINMADRDPYRSNLFFPKIYSTIETITPRLAKSIVGFRPYIPMRASRDEFQESAMAIQDYMDALLYKDAYEVKTRHLLKMVATYGIGFLEPIPVFENVKESYAEPVVIGGVQVGRELKERVVPKFRLKLKIIPPWNVYADGWHQSIDEQMAMITFEVVTKKWVKEKIEEGVFNEIDLDKITSSSIESADEHGWARRMLQSVGIREPKQTDKVGTLGRYMSKDRYIWTWNGIDVLKDSDNPYSKENNGHGGINLVRYIDALDPLWEDSFHGRGTAKELRILQDAMNETYDLAFDNHHLLNQGMIVYNEQAVNPDQLVAIGGVRIPVSADKPLREAVDKIETPGLPADHYNLPTLLENWMDKASGIFDVQRGENAGGDSTATEVSILQRTGDLRSEEKINILENVALTRLGRLCMGHMDQFAGVDDMYDVIGERALDVFTMNADRLPGGYDFEFRGTSSIMDDFKERADFREIYAMIGQSPVARPGGMERELLKRYQFSDKQINEILMTDDEFQQMLEEQVNNAQTDQLTQIQDNKRLARNDGPTRTAQSVAEQPTIQNPLGRNNGDG